MEATVTMSLIEHKSMELRVEQAERIAKEYQLVIAEIVQRHPSIADTVKSFKIIRETSGRI